MSSIKIQRIISSLQKISNNLETLKQSNIKLKNIYLQKAISFIYNPVSYRELKMNIDNDILLFQDIKKELNKCNNLISLNNVIVSFKERLGGSILYDVKRDDFRKKLNIRKK